MAESKSRWFLSVLVSTLLLSTGTAFQKGEHIKYYAEQMGIRLLDSPYEGTIRTHYQMWRLWDKSKHPYSEIALVVHWQSYWTKESSPLSLRSPECQALGPMKVYAVQNGYASPIIFGYIGGRYDTTFLYFQNLGAISDLIDFVGELPEPPVIVDGKYFGWRGVRLPPEWRPTQDLLVSDGYLFLKRGALNTPLQRAMWYLHCLSDLYYRLGHKPIRVDDWNFVAQRTREWLEGYKGWLKLDGYEFLPAYVNATYGAELIVQLEVLEPYFLPQTSLDKQPLLVQRLLVGLPAFYQPHLATIVSHYPLGGRNGDSWVFLLHLVKLASLGKKGCESAQKLLLPSLRYAIKFAHNCNYCFPVFFDWQTAMPLQYEERDAIFAYALAMVLGYEIFGEHEFMQEAQRALEHAGEEEFNSVYELHNEGMGIAACGHLFQHTKDKRYLELAQRLLAYLLHQTWFYEADWGFATGYPTFFALSAMPGIYAAPLEQHLAASYVDEGLTLLGQNFPLPARKLATAFVQHSIGVMRYAYPDKLPPGALAERAWLYLGGWSNDPSAPIPVEDFHPGFRFCGLWGQEIYGAGVAADFARLASIYKSGTTPPPSVQFSLYPRIARIPRGGDASLWCYYADQEPEYRFILPEGISVRYARDNKKTQIILHADTNLAPGEYFGYAHLKMKHSLKTYVLRLIVYQPITWSNDLLFTPKLWQVFMNDPKFDCSHQGIVLEVGEGRQWGVAAIPNVMLDISKAQRLTIQIASLSPNARWMVKLSCDVDKDGQVAGGQDDLLPFGVQTTTGTFTRDLASLFSNLFPNQKQITLGFLQLAIEGPPGAKVHFSKLVLE